MRAKELFCVCLVLAIAAGCRKKSEPVAETKPAPESTASQPRQEMNTVTVNITNSNGSVSQVRLRKQGVGYVGPRGEYYDHLPTDEELKPIYGF
jgi:hypothetical protein